MAFSWVGISARCWHDKVEQRQRFSSFFVMFFECEEVDMAGLHMCFFPDLWAGMESLGQPKDGWE